MGRARRSRRWVYILAAIALVIFLTTDDRHAGVIADGRQMAWTAIAMVEGGGLGQARARDLTVPRPGKGDSVSRYGIAMSVAQIPAATAAPFVEEWRGSGSSQPLFIVASFVFVLLAAVFAGSAANALGASPRGESIAVLLTTLGGPLASYASLDLSEPLQAAALAAAYSAAVRQSGLFAGLAAGVAVLTKSSMLVVAPLACLPLLAGPRETRARDVTLATLAFGACGAIWLVLEIVRFGHPFASYAGEEFTHPFADGLWRLLLGVNKGILWYFPAIVAVAIGVRHTRMWRSERGLAFAGAVLPFLALLSLAAPWWAWDGSGGWGPRLLVPAIPLLAPWAAIEMESWRSAARTALVAACVLANLPPLLQHPVPVLNYELASTWPPVDAGLARSVPSFARREVDGQFAVMPAVVLAKESRAADLLVFPWFAWASRSTDEATARRLESPPWHVARPDIHPDVPDGGRLAPDAARVLTRRPQWRFWGRGFFPSEEDRQYGRVYDGGLADQVLRAQQMREAPLALRLALRLVQLAPAGFSDALLMESYRLLGRDGDAAAYLTSLPMDRRQHPAINLVLALFERDRGDDRAAHAFLQSVADAFPNSPVQRALASPLTTWPSDFASMTEDVSLQVGSGK